MEKAVRDILVERAIKYNDPQYFTEDPIIFPKHFAGLLGSGGASLRDVEVAGLLAAHLAWGRRSMIVRDCIRLFDHMEWRPAEYVDSGCWRDDAASLHRTIKWSDIAAICARLKALYGQYESLECLNQPQIRTLVYGAKEDPKAANKKINMFRRWMARRDGKVDLGLWRNTSPAGLVIPLDVHVHRCAAELGLTERRSADLRTAMEITDAFREIFPDDPCLGDFALFGYGVTR